jgi:peptidylprolyl isomerase
MLNKLILTSLLLLSLVIPNGLRANGLIEAKHGLRYKVLAPGEGMTAAPGKIATIHFSIWEDNDSEKGGKIFDSREEGMPVSFKIGTKKFLEGLNIGVNSMKVGEMRRMYIPSHIDPSKDNSEFPDNVDLIFEVELLEIR